MKESAYYMAVFWWRSLERW